MNEIIKQSREPIAIIVELLVFISMVWSVVMVFVHGARTGLLREMASTGGTTMGIASLVLLILAVAFCAMVTPITKHAALLARAGMLIAYVGAVISLFFLIVGLVASDSPGLLAALEGLGGLTDVGIKVLCGYVMMHMARAIDLHEDSAEPLSISGAPGPRTAPPVKKGELASGVRWDRAADAVQSVPSRTTEPLPGGQNPMHEGCPRFGGRSS